MLYSFDGKEPRIGSETYVSETALVIGDVEIGDNCYVGHGAVLRGDYGSIRIGNGTAVEEAVVIHAPPGSTCCIVSRYILCLVTSGAFSYSLRISMNLVVWPIASLTRSLA